MLNVPFDLYGTDWGRYRNYRGFAQNKIDCLKHYKFCFCYENQKNINGYITEKIFNCFQAGCVPIYWGAKNIEFFVPKNCFIAREDFLNQEQLYDFITKMNRQEYEEYLNNIRKYLECDCRAKLFSIDNFVKIVSDAIFN
ncbi:hypothetical protein CVU75_00840 [Candidatus Dependentiae bacterium HGW-Dependentiae-1]|nr:MAG: hypothetical protein CVU75_00840 [Candidatus Dependentiae bacterium HGW-Dependentiae-1]